MIRLRNARPGLTTRHACWKVPINDSSSRRRHDLLDDHWARRSLSHDSLSAGRYMSPAWVSSSMPRKVRQCEGPSSLSVARGTPNSVQTACILSRFCWHSWAADGNEVVQIMVYSRNPNIKHDSRFSGLSGDQREGHCPHSAYPPTPPPAGSGPVGGLEQAGTLIGCPALLLMHLCPAVRLLLPRTPLMCT